jgi:hypothetical protein
MWELLLLQSPTMVPEKLLDGLEVTARWEPQEEGMMSTAASFPSVVKPRFIKPVGESQTSKGDVW